MVNGQLSMVDAGGEGRGAISSLRLCTFALKWFLLAGLVVAALLWTRPAAAQDGLPGTPVLAHVQYADAAALSRLVGAYDVWEVDRAQQTALALLKPGEIAALRQAGYTVTVDSARTAAEAPPPFIGPRTADGIPGYACYRTVTETYASIDALVAAHPTLVQKVDIGDSWLKAQARPGGDDIFAVVLTNQAIAGPKPRFFVMAAIHAREYATAESAMRFAEQLVNGYGVDADATWLLDYTEIHIVTQANPDGRRRAEANVLWRKNVNDDFCSSPDAIGVDLNRNSSFKWGICTAQGCSSAFACAETYRGQSAASEPEVQALESYMRSIFPDQRGPGDDDPAPLDTSGVMITVHSYGEWVLYPWGFTPTPSPNDEGQRVLGQKLGYYLPTLLPSYPGERYTVCQAGAGNCLYPTDGATDDFSYGELGIPSYTFEIGLTFFQPCTGFENRIVGPVLDSLRYAAKVTHRPYQQPFGPDAITVTVTPATVLAGAPATLTVTLDNTRFAPAADDPDPQTHARNIFTGVVTLGQPRWVTTTAAPSYALTPADGAFDAPAEAALLAIDTTGWAPGAHLLVVEGQNSDGQWGAPGAAFLTVQAQQQIVGLAAQSSSPTALGSATHFTATVTAGTEISYAWAFGDGALGSGVHPEHSYAEIGEFTAVVTATNSLGSAVAQTVVAVVAPPAQMYLPVIVGAE
jgi:carboxypeptidase T